jgi:type I restriction enzyme S subunit
MKEGEGPYELPEGWVWAKVEKISDSIQYGYTSKATNENVGPKLLRITDIQNNNVIWDDVPYCEIDEADKSKYLLQPGDLVFARTGATVGKSYLIGENVPYESIFASYLIRIKPAKSINIKFIHNYFQTSFYWSQISESMSGIGQPNVNGKKLANLSIPLPPLPEQRRIVAKIEELFTQLDAGVSALEKARAQLKRYRQSVLKAAVEGKLTEECRRDHPDVEPASTLLERIEREREKSGKGRGKKLPPLDTSGLPELPEGWEWVNFGEIVVESQNGIAKRRSDHGTPTHVLRLSDIFERISKNLING